MKKLGLTSFLLIAILSVSLGCEPATEESVDPPPVINDLNGLAGYWVLDSLTITEDEEENTLTPESTPQSARGHIEIVAESETTGEAGLVLITLNNQLLSTDETPDVDMISLVLEENNKIVVTHSDEEVEVFTAILDDDTLTLDLDVDDPRNTDDEEDWQAVFKLSELPANPLIDEWTVTMLSDQDSTPSECLDVEEGGSMITSYVMFFYESGIFRLGGITDFFSDEECEEYDHSEGAEDGGYYEATDDSFELWIVNHPENEDPAYSQHSGFDYTIADDTLTMTQTFCEEEGCQEILVITAVPRVIGPG